MSAFNRPVLPTTGTSPDEQRSRSGLGEIVRALLDSGAFLNRLFPGKVQQNPQGTGVQVQLAWGDMNRLPAASTVTAFLPKVVPRQIGAPLVISKSSPTGLVMVQPAGVGIDGRTRPTVDGVATGFQFSEAGQRELMTDGVNWFTRRDGAAGGKVGPGDNDNQELFWNGNIWVPRLPRTAQYHDTTHSPVALYQLNRSLADSSGNGLDLVTSAGTARYVEMLPAILGGFFDGWWMSEPTAAAALRITGDITVEMLMVMRIYRPDVVALFAHGNSSETEANNTLYQTSVSTTFTLNWLQESGAGTDATYTGTEQPPDVLPCHFAVTRASGIVRYHVNGAPIGTASSVLTLPTGGSTGRLSVGGATGLNPFSGMMASFKIINSALSSGQLTEEYNRTLAPVLGYR